MMNLPHKYKWLEKYHSFGVFKEMLSLYGVHEYKGLHDNPIITGWAREIKPYVGIDYLKDSTPWCGLVMGVCVYRSGHVPPKICVRAKEWVKFGWASETPMFGDILVFIRKGGGHVGLYVAEDDDCYHVLGGNQRNKVCITRIEKDRLISSRRAPEGSFKCLNASRKRIYMDKSGLISDNEA